ncbi:MAG: Sensor protein [uncultured bacterium]|nr:MAG: Sensor protein [uncultured bacterium]
MNNKKQIEIDSNVAKLLVDITHELRTPLIGVLGFTELLTKEVSDKLNDNQKEYLKSIESCGRFQLNIINNLIELLKCTFNHFKMNIEQVVMEDLIDSFISFAEHDLKLDRQKIIKDISPEVEFIHVDINKFKLIVVNLLSTFLKKEMKGELKFNAIKDEKDFILKITYSCIDCNEKMVDFDNLENSSEDSYITLSLTKKLVELHEGKINFSKNDCNCFCEIRIPGRD